MTRRQDDSLTPPTAFWQGRSRPGHAPPHAPLFGPPTPRLGAGSVPPGYRPGSVAFPTDGPAPARRRPRLWATLAVLAAAGVVVGLVVGGFSSSSPAVCQALDDGQDALSATRTTYGAAGTSEAGQRMLREAAATVRTACPEHSGEAGQMQAFADLLDLERALGG
jgi:hypothetical protein